MDASDFGRYGALSLLKRNDPNTIVATYPIDDAEVTFGRDSTCSIRLYYPTVSGLHCKLIFNETDSSSAAFLVVLGTNGVSIDGDAVFPAPPGAPPTTVPLPNGSTLDIHKKRFRFACPPKYLRPVLLASPSPRKSARRALRMSMIASAQVFSPRPSADPRENLRLLQSPLRQAQDEAEIVLVESDTPRVVEADRDLVILDEVNLPPPPIPAPVFAPAPPRTPARRPRNSLHRAVLIRSAQRAEMRREMWHEEERDAEEVEDFITPVKEADEEGEEADQDGDAKMENTPSRSMLKSSWRKSLEAGLSWALGLQQDNDAPRENEEITDEAEMDEDVVEDENYEENANEEEAMDEDDEEINAHDENEGDEENDYYREEEPEEHLYPTMDEIRAAESEEPGTPLGARPLGKFMTPQPGYAQAERRAGRYSLGGAGPRRVRVVEPWKVEDIVVPLKEDVKEEDRPAPSEKGTEIEETPRRGWSVRSARASPVKADREKLSAEEREAIRDRRRSAAVMPDMFFSGQAPGLAPATPRPAPVPSPNKEPAESEDTHVMLARMREMVDSAKRRQSVNPFHPRTPATSPRKKAEFSLLASEDEHEWQRVQRQVQEQEGSETEVESERERSPVRSTQLGRAPPLPRQPGVEHEQAQEMEVEYTGVRALFNSRTTVPATPRMDGMKAMFLREAHIRENDAPKAGPSGIAEETLEDVGQLLQTPAGWRPSAVSAIEEVAEEPQAEPMETEPTMDTSQSSHGQLAAAKVVRRPRTKTAESTQSTSTRTTAIPKAPRTLRAKFEAAAHEPVRAVPQTAPAKVPATRKRTIVAVEDSQVTEVLPEAAVRRTRRGLASESESEDVPAAPQTLRRTTRTKTPTPEPQSAPTKTTRTASKRPAKGQAIESETEGTEAESSKADAARVRKTTRNRVPVGTIKEEAEEGTLAKEPAEQRAPAPARARVARTTPVPASAPAARTRASARKAATPVPEGQERPMEKENTPDPSEEASSAPARKVTRRKGESAEPAVAPITAATKSAGSRIARGGKVVAKR